jgi:hypothetical protein
MQGEVCGPEKFIVSGDPRPNTAREASTFTDEKSAVEDVPPADLACISINAGQTDLGVCLESRFSRGKRFWHPEMTTKASYPIQSDTGYSECAVVAKRQCTSVRQAHGIFGA